MVITISREYAAYGRSVAKGLSEALGIEYYDVDVIRRTAKVSGYSEEDVTTTVPTTRSSRHRERSYLNSRRKTALSSGAVLTSSSGKQEWRPLTFSFMRTKTSASEDARNSENTERRIQRNSSTGVTTGGKPIIMPIPVIPWGTTRIMIYP